MIMAASAIADFLKYIIDKVGPYIAFAMVNLPGLIWLIFAMVAVMKAMQYSGAAFWDSIPSADPRYNHSVDDFVDAKPFSALPTFSK